MCRLLASTFTDTSPELRRLLFTHAMTIATSDDKQIYGWGIADPNYLFKSWRQFSLDPVAPGEIANLRRADNWIGHVRKPSPGTALTSQESHPFVFGNGEFIATHNGTFYEGPGVSAQDGEPDVDSFRALRRLYHSIKESGDSFDAGFSRWLDTEDGRSEWTLHCLYNGSLYIARGVRTMYLMAVGNGYVACTSHSVLNSLWSFIDKYFTQVKLGKDIITVKEGNLLELRPGQVAYRQTAFALPKVPAVEVDRGVRWAK